MATPWPAGLPCQPEVGSWQETPQPAAVRFQPEIGPAIMRRCGTVRSFVASASFVMTSAQYLVLEAWYWTDLAGGTLRFALDHPVTGAALEWTFEAEPQMSAITNRKVRVQVQLRGHP